MQNEYVDVIDVNNHIKERRLKKYCHQKGLLHRGAALLIFQDKNFKTLLLQKRSQRVKNPGLFCNPGGHVRSGESYGAAAKRECFEELFSGTKQEKPPGIKLKRLFIFLKDDPCDRELITVYRGVYSGPFSPDKREVKYLKFITLRRIKKDLVVHPDRYTSTFQIIFKNYLHYLS